MNNKLTLVVLASLAASAACAQLTYDGAVFEAATETNCTIGAGFRVANGSITGPGAGTGSLALTGLQAIRLPRDPGSPQSFHAATETHFCFSVGLVPIQISSSLTGESTEGKLVIGGGSTESDTIAVVRTNFYLEWYSDDNNNDLWDTGEERQFVNSFGSTVTNPLVGNGFLEYSETYGYNWSYILASGLNYMITGKHSVEGTNYSTIIDPPTVVTHEYTNPYAGANLDFSYTAVPEPASLCVLGLGTLAFLRRKKA